jgi:putative spermidine/putrescine transport system permease protein
VTAQSIDRRLSRVLRRRPWAGLTGLLTLPMLWLVVAYLGSLAAMLITAFWTTDTFTGAVVRTPTLDNFRTLLHDEVYRTIALRSLLVALAVTVIDAVAALPIAFYMAKVATPRVRQVMVVAVLTPLWASYLVKAYAWRTMFGEHGVIGWALGPIGGTGPAYGIGATTVTLAYLWLPYMILPLYAGLERVPDSLLEAAGDLGAGTWRTMTTVVLPLLYPAVIAGSIFTFSLTLGDYIAVKIVGGASQLFANVIYDNIGTANNLPFAAAAATFPVLAIVIYLVLVRRSGAIANL